MWLQLLFSRRGRPTAAVRARFRLSVLRLELLEDRLCLSKLFASGAYADRVYRYDVQPAGTPVLDLTISDPSLNTPTGLAFSPTNELFVVNSASIRQTTGTVSRFLDPGGAPTPNPIQPVITDSHFGFPFGAVFVGGELYVTNVIDRGSSNSNVLWFTFDRFGNAVFDRAVATDLPGPSVREITVGAGNELFVAQAGAAQNNVTRYLFDASGNTIPNGVITGGGLNSPYGLAFSPWGELFVANFAGNSVSRFVFDDAGNAMPNGAITGSCLKSPVGVAFSPWGELFVSNDSAPGGICTWTFDDSHNATFNRSFSSPDRLSFIKFLPEAPSTPSVGQPSGITSLVVFVAGQQLETTTVGVTLPSPGQKITLAPLALEPPTEELVGEDAGARPVPQAPLDLQTIPRQLLDLVFADWETTLFGEALPADLAPVW